MHEIVIQNGGGAQKTATKDLGYLIVGGNSSPPWTYSTYGRKIEKVIAGGSSMAIIHEDGLMTRGSCRDSVDGRMKKTAP